MAVVFLGLIIAGSFLVAAALNKNLRRLASGLSLFFVFVSAGVFRFYVQDSSVHEHELDNFVEQSIEVEGVVKNEVDIRQASQRIILSADKIIFKEYEYEIDQKILISTDLFPRFDYGERLRVSGKLKLPENFFTDAGKEFDYINYLKKDSIFYTLPFAKVEILSVGEGSKLKAGILFIKHRFLNSIEKAIPAPESALLGGLLLGTKQSLGEGLQNDFVRTGLVHIIVLSGYNVTIIAEALIKMLSLISVAAGIYFGAFAIIVFVIMTGAGATIMRAGIMAILALIARATGRSSQIVRALILAAGIMVFLNPYILFFDISFQLSFLATIGLIFISPLFKGWFKFLPERFGLREIISATIGVQAFVLPFILYKMGNLSIVAPITNTLVLPFIPITMFFGFISGGLSFILPVLGMPFGWVAYILLKYEITIVETFSRLNFSSISIAHFPFSLVLIFYALVSYYLWRYYKNHEIR